MFTRVKSVAELNAMRESGHMLALVLQLLTKNMQPGMSTKELAVLARTELGKLGGQPSILGYQGFPDVICASINNEVVHGIPSETKIIQSGDIVSIDLCVTFKNMITDAAVSVIVGEAITQRDVDLLEYTNKALTAGINAVHDGVKTGDIGAVVESVLNRKNYGIVRDLVGHGVGDKVHEDPNIPNYGKHGSGPKLFKGMTIAIEPMATLGSDRVYVGPDGWTVLTWDGSRSAHFEHTVVITEDGAEVLTKLD
jgi:methionyl aminopeptidase